MPEIATQKSNFAESSGRIRIRDAATKLALGLASVVVFLLVESAPVAAQPAAAYNFAQLVRDQQDAIALQQAHMEHREVTIVALVYKVLPDDTSGMQHERFLLKLVNGTTILVAHDLSFATRVPIHEGNLVRVHGEYIWNPRGGVIHWTHWSDTPRHEGGWIDYAGRRYQ